MFYVTALNLGTPMLLRRWPHTVSWINSWQCGNSRSNRSMIFECLKCKELIDAEDEWAGQEGKCPHCKEKILLPRHGMESAVHPPADNVRHSRKSPMGGASVGLWLLVPTLFFVFHDALIGKFAWAAVRWLNPGLVPSGWGYVGATEQEYKIGFAAGHIEGLRYTNLMLSGGGAPSEGTIDNLAKREGRSDAWQEGFRDGVKDGFKP